MRFLQTTLSLAFTVILAGLLHGDIVYVDSNLGDDANTGNSNAPVRTLQQAVDRIRNTGGTLHIAADSVFNASLDLRGATAPIVVEGNGAQINLGTNVTNWNWIPDGDGYILDQDLQRTLPSNLANSGLYQIATLFVNDKPLHLYDSRFSDAPGPGQVEYVEYNGEVRMRAVFRQGENPGNATIIATGDYGTSSVIANTTDITIRNLTTRYSGNDGFNISGTSFEDGGPIRLESVAAFFNGDEGISAHQQSSSIVSDSVVAFNGSFAGGVADVGSSETEYHRLVSMGNYSNNSLFFFGDNHLLSDAVIDGSIRIGPNSNLVQSGVQNFADASDSNELPEFFHNALQRHAELQRFTGIFVPVPEPSSFVLFGMACCLFNRRRRG